MSIPVVYEDEWLLVVDKPSGLLTVPTPKKESRTLTSILRLYPCHRLDRETSGLIIYAKEKFLQKKMMDEFRMQRVKKTYIAFVQGHLKQASGEIRNRIDGLNAITRYRVLEKKGDFEVVEVKPLTGRTNQIRIHFKHMGHPIVGESRFAFRKDFALRFKRLCLQAKALEFIHPVTKKYIKLDIGLAQDLRDFLKADA